MHRWKHSALAAAILVSTALPLTGASALTLGQLRVQSALGEPLRAQIAITSLSANEAESLRANAASPDAFNRHGVGYSPLMAQLQINLQRRADGTAFLQLSTRAPVNEPFLDLVLNAAWNGGEIVRSYTVLLDPAPTAAADTPRTIDRPVIPSPNVPAVAADTGVPAPAATTETTASSPSPAPVPAEAAPVEATPATASAPHSNDTYARAYAWLQSQSAEENPRSAAPAVTGITRASDASGATPAASATTGTPATAPSPTASSTRASSQAAGYTAGATITTRRGDNASRIARRHLPANVSLDQMLVALQRTNPEAFIQGNINLLRAGVALAMPELATIQSVSAQEARSIVAAQTQDFRRYQAKVAQAAPRISADSSGQRTLSGVVTRVTDGAVSGRPELVVGSPSSDDVRRAEEERLAQQRQQQENTEREQALQANIRRLEELQKQAADISQKPASDPADASDSGGAAAATGSPSSSDSTGAGIEVTPPVPLPSTASEPQPDTATTPDAPAPDGSASEGTTAPAAATQTPGTPTPDTPSSNTEPAPAPVPPAAQPVASAAGVQDNPSLLWGAAAIVLLLAGYGAYRWRKNRVQSEEDQDPDEDAPAPNNNLRRTFFGDDTTEQDDQEKAGENTAPGEASSAGYSTGVSSMSYSPSQIDASGEGDPVLEADVLLAYGRDQQAEEVLKEALQNNPERTAIHVRLAEIHATRQDRQAFAATARTLQTLTQAQGSDWLKVAELGRNLDPSNPLYQAGAPLQSPDHSSQAPSPIPPVLTATASVEAAAGTESGLDFDLQASSPASPQAHARQEMADLDAGLDFQTDAEVEKAALAPTVGTASAAAGSQSDSRFHGLDLDLDLSLGDVATPTTKPAEDPLPKAATEKTLDLPELSFSDSTAPDLQPGKERDDDPLTSTLEFDLAALSLDLDTPSSDKPQSPTPAQENAPSTPSEFDLDMGLELDEASSSPATDDPLSTKLALAREFHALGDDEGARALAQEVLDDASGSLKQQAQALLKELG
ncbi:pilus assembly protein FimV [Lampropedia hyalina DSM 16112]|jgi:pilus assembly protein FimV|uniref:Pilus assembly protein FimV n=1 Tax=Lampropedia hyalina DSM 16112 TaxID=1122156 RepID=A0A1M4V934_9BURK|nr:FimV/HubP family polar landmark protein [Lampropedia hyalina]SHE65358.1 pilus assembly protein FimV [Lampropedia hyalina DSM 16112]